MEPGQGAVGARDTGFHYELAALIGAGDLLRSVASDLPQARVVDLVQGLALVPVTRELSVALAGIGDPLPPETGFWRWSPGVLHLLQRASAAGPLAYLEADYLGRDGRQAAAVWHGGVVVCGPLFLSRSEPFPRTGAGPIGAVLRKLGVVAAGPQDEFVVLGLGRHRSTEDWCQTTTG